jgi:hypothetical protein
MVCCFMSAGTDAEHSGRQNISRRVGTAQMCIWERRRQGIIACMKKLRADSIQGEPAAIRCKMFCLLVWNLKMQRAVMVPVA